MFGAEAVNSFDLLYYPMEPECDRYVLIAHEDFEVSIHLSKDKETVESVSVELGNTTARIRSNSALNDYTLLINGYDSQIPFRNRDVKDRVPLKLLKY